MEKLVLTDNTELEIMDGASWITFGFKQIILPHWIR